MRDENKKAFYWNPGKSSYPLPEKKKTLGARHASYSARIELTSTTGSGRPSCIDVVLGFWLEVLRRRDEFENRRKNHNYTYTYTTTCVIAYGRRYYAHWCYTFGDNMEALGWDILKRNRCVTVRRQTRTYSTGHLLRVINGKAVPGWISNLRMGAFYTNFSTTTPEYIIFLYIPACLS